MLGSQLQKYTEETPPPPALPPRLPVMIIKLCRHLPESGPWSRGTQFSS